MDLSTYAVLLTIGAILFSGLVFTGIAYAYTSEKRQVRPSTQGHDDDAADTPSAADRSTQARSAA